MPSFASTDGPKQAVPIKNHRYQIPRYPFGGPMVQGNDPMPGTGMLVPWTRVSTILDTHEDKEGIFKWTKRLVVKGLGAREDLYALAAATRLEDKAGLLKIADQAFDYAKGQASSNLGTALHGFLERWVEGDKDLVIPAQWKGDVAAVMAAFQDANIRLRPDLQEMCVVRPDLKDGDAGGLAGRLDLVVEMFNPETNEWELILADYKTGSDPLAYGSWKIQQQLGLYGTAWAIWDGTHWRPMPTIRRDKILMVHVLPGQASCQIHIGDVDAEELEGDLQAAYRTRRRRKEAKKAWCPLVTVEDGAIVEPSGSGTAMVGDQAVSESSAEYAAAKVAELESAVPIGPTRPIEVRHLIDPEAAKRIEAGYDAQTVAEQTRTAATKPTPVDPSEPATPEDREKARTAATKPTPEIGQAVAAGIAAERAAATVARVAAESNPNTDGDDEVPDVHAERAKREGVTWTEARARNLADRYSGEPKDVVQAVIQGELTRTGPVPDETARNGHTHASALAPLAGPGERGCGVCGRKGHRRGSPKCLGDADPFAKFDPHQVPVDRAAQTFDTDQNEIDNGDKPAWCRCTTRAKGWTAPADGVGPWECGDCGLPSKLGVPLAVQTGEQVEVAGITFTKTGDSPFPELPERTVTQRAGDLIGDARDRKDDGSMTTGDVAILSGDEAEIRKWWTPNGDPDDDTTEADLAAALRAGEMVRAGREELISDEDRFRLADAERAEREQEQDNPRNHAFESGPGSSGMVCTRKVMRDGGGDECGADARAHNPTDEEVLAAEDNRAHGVFNESDAAVMATDRAEVDAMVHSDDPDSQPDPFDEDGSDALTPAEGWLKLIKHAKDKAELRAIRADAMAVGQWDQELTRAGLERIKVLAQQG